MATHDPKEVEEVETLQALMRLVRGDPRLTNVLLGLLLLCNAGVL